MLADLRKQIFGGWLDLRQLVADRRLILRDATVALGPKGPKSRPLQFATQALLLPTALLFGVSGVVNLIVDPPALDIDRAIQQQQELERVLEGADGKFDWKGTTPPGSRPELEKLSREELDGLVSRKQEEITQLRAGTGGERDEAALQDAVAMLLAARDISLRRSMEDLNRSLSAATAETRSNQAFLLALQKVSSLEAQYRSLIVGIGVVFSALLFRGLVKNRFPAERWSDRGHDVHLYVVSAALAPIALCGGVLSLVLDYSIRYRIDWYVASHNVLLVGLSAWGIHALWLAASRIASIGADTSVEALRGRRLAIVGRLMLSNVVSQLIVAATVGAIGAVVFGIVYKRLMEGAG